MNRRNYRAEFARLKEEVEKEFGNHCPHNRNGIHLIFEIDGHLRTSNLSECEHCDRPRKVAAVSFLMADALGPKDKPLYLPDIWVSTLDKANTSRVKLYGGIDLDEV